MTARNIFRYKTRMFMTIFGVCGAVSLLTAGLAVQSLDRTDRKPTVRGTHPPRPDRRRESRHQQRQQREIAGTLEGQNRQSSTAVRYEELCRKTAGRRTIKQSITLLSTDDAYNFNRYLTLRDPQRTHQPQILVSNGAVISNSSPNAQRLSRRHLRQTTKRRNAPSGVAGISQGSHQPFPYS